MRANHYPLRRTLHFYRSVYRHRRPEVYATLLRQQHLLDARVEAGHVVVMHGPGDEPADGHLLVQRTALTANRDGADFFRAVNAHVGHVLRSAGFLAVGKRHWREYISPGAHVVSLTAQERGQSLPSVPVRAHLEWAWDIEHHSERTWLVPLPGRRFLTAQGPTYGPLHQWLLERIRKREKINGVELISGQYTSLTFRDGQWLCSHQGEWCPCAADANWRITLNMQALLELGYSAEAYYSAQFTFDEAQAALRRCSPFDELVESVEPHEVPKGRHGRVGGRCLHFGRGCGRDLKEVLKFGVLEPPTAEVRLVVLASQRNAPEERHRLANMVRAHLLPRDELQQEGRQGALASVGAADGRDTIFTLWAGGRFGRQFGLRPFDVIRKIYTYDPDSGQFSESDGLAEVYEAADTAKKRLIALVLVDDKMDKDTHDALMLKFRGRRALPLKQSRLVANESRARGANPTWVNLALTLAQRAGAIPWDLDDMPGVDEKTVFLGMDLGHDHRARKSRLALTLFSHMGRPMADRVIDCPANDERIPPRVLTQDVPNFLFWRDGPSPTQVIVHRDGRYLPGEEEDLLEGLSSVQRVSLVSIKKDTKTRLSAERMEGACMKIDSHRALIVTNDQARKTGMPVPLEVELNEPGDRTLGEILAQVFWLTRVYQGNAYNPKRLPATTGWAHNIAATGSKTHLKGWDHPEG